MARLDICVRETGDDEEMCVVEQMTGPANCKRRGQTATDKTRGYALILGPASCK